MFLETKTNNEFHENGQLAYTETIAILSPVSSHRYEKRRRCPDGFEWVRIGRQAKYFDNGQLAWELNYDNNGAIIKDRKPSYRKDGSIIV